MDLVFSSNDLIIIDKYEQDKMIFIAYEINKSFTFDYYYNTLTTYEVEEIIKNLFHNEGYDIEDIIEEFRASQLYNLIKENEDAED